MVLIRGVERNIDPGELRAQLNDRIKSIFRGPLLEAVPFPGGPYDVPDEIGNGHPLLVVLSYEGCTVGPSVDALPDLIARIYERKGAEGGSLRQLRNNLVFIVADESRIEEMRQKMARRLALQDLKKPEYLSDLVASHVCRGSAPRNRRRSMRFVPDATPPATPRWRFGSFLHRLRRSFRRRSGWRVCEAATSI